MSFKPKYRKKKTINHLVIRLQKNPSIIRNPNWGKGKIMKKKTFGSWLTAAPATSVAVSFGVWCVGGLGKQRWKREEARLWVFCISFCVWRLEKDLSDKDDVAEIYSLA